MFEILTTRLSRLVTELRGQARLTGEGIDAVLRELRVSLLEADVALAVVRELTVQIREQALGTEVLKSLTPGQSVIKIVRDALIQVLGGSEAGLHLATEPPAIILLAGLQGSGKTTTAAKLGRWLRERGRKRVLLAGCDVYRPAAFEQLALLAGENGLDMFEAESGLPPESIAEAALKLARSRLMDVLIVDSAGRRHVDGEMMEEMRRLHEVLQPTDTLFVLDSMMGQDAVTAASAFSSAVPLTGLILTKVDGDARGGAALSVRRVTGTPILFLGTGERVAELAPFHPQRLASRILGMGDVLSLIEQVERGTDRDKAARLSRKVIKGRGFELDDFRDQLRQMRDLGGVAGLLDKLPSAQSLPPTVSNQFNDRELIRLGAIIDSMTPAERRRPDIINGSRKQRIAVGSGTLIQDVNRLLKQFKQMQKMLKRVARTGGMAGILDGLSGSSLGRFRR